MAHRVGALAWKVQCPKFYSWHWMISQRTMNVAMVVPCGTIEGQWYLIKINGLVRPTCLSGQARLGCEYETMSSTYSVAFITGVFITIKMYHSPELIYQLWGGLAVLGGSEGKQGQEKGFQKVEGNILKKMVLSTKPCSRSKKMKNRPSL